MSKYHRNIIDYRYYIKRDLENIYDGNYYLNEFRPGRVLAVLESGEIYMYNLLRGWKNHYYSEEDFNDRMNPTDEEKRIQLIRDEIDIRMRLNGYSQETLAFRVGISQAKMSRILNRESSPSISELWKFADAFDCDLLEMLDFSGSLN